MPEFDFLQALIYSLVGLLGSGVGGGSVFVYVRRHLDLRFQERVAEIDERKTESATFASVVTTFRMYIENQGEWVRERNRIQAESQQDYRKFMSETLGAMAELRNAISKLTLASSQMETSIVTEQARQGVVLGKILDDQRVVRAGIDNMLVSAQELKASVTEALGLDTLERAKILFLLEKLVAQATGGDERPDDPGATGETESAATEASEGSQK
jgi:hypothetical protein